VYDPSVIRSIRIHHTGGPDALELDELPTPTPGAGQVLVRHHAIGLNFIDTYHRSGLYPLPVLPHGIGVEAAGVVEALGPGVTEVALGARVAYASGAPGAYSEARIIDIERLVPLPNGIDFETAAAVLLKGMTVEYLIHRCYPVTAGMTVLWHAAAGGVGLIACQWLASLGVTVIGTVGSHEKAELAQRHGCAHTIVYTEERFADRVRELTQGKGVPVVFDSVGRETFMDSLDCLCRRGTMVSFGNASGKPEPLDIGILATKGGLFVTRPILWAYTSERDELLASANALFDVVERGVVKVEINQRWPLARAVDAHRALEARETTGASLLLP